ncbi:hypothetical protein [Dactylosporangium sp. NPDC005555]|uniref:hypothetical protein n=1 Tax=Dactylosporangium sp. NPDC005555 TaxID=3154889 RepID=UPI0033A42246
MDTSYYPQRVRQMVTPVRRDHEPGLFTRLVAPMRRMTLVIDADTVGSRDSRSVAGAVLSTLLDHPYLDCYVFDDRDPEARGRQLREWLVVPPGGREVDPALDLDSGYARQHTHPDAKISTVAAAAGADIVVTERDHLFEARLWTVEDPCRWAMDPQCFRPRQAIALIGLYLRAQGHHRIWEPVESLPESLDRKRFYADGAHTLVPAAFQWCELYENHGPGTPRSAAASSVTYRTELSLWQRDVMHQALQQSDDFYAFNATCLAFDQCLLLMMGALDAAALVVHSALRVDCHERLAAWQNKDWVTHLAARHADLAALVAPGTPGRHLLEVLRALRNTVHKASLASTARGEMRSFGRFRPLLTLPADPVFTTSLAALGRPEDWGVTTSPAYMDPGVFLDRLIVLQTGLLDDLMTALLQEALKRAAAGQSGWDPTGRIGDRRYGPSPEYLLCLLGLDVARGRGPDPAIKG